MVSSERGAKDDVTTKVADVFVGPPKTTEASTSTSTSTSTAKSAAEFAAIVSGLEAGARQANVHHALHALVHMGGALGKAAAAVVDGRASIVAPPTGDIDALRRVVADAVTSVGGKQLGNTAYARLQGALTAFRAGSVRPVVFGVEAVTFPEQLPPAPKLQVHRGFDKAVDGLRLDEPHSIDDLQSYVDQRFGRFALNDLVVEGRTIELHHGSREETFASLKERGFGACVRVRTPEAVLHNELYCVRHRETGEVRYVLTEIWGGTRLGHMQKLLKAAVVDGPNGPQRLKSQQVELHTEPLRRPEEIYRRTSRALLASGTVPASVVVGFKASVLKELGRRAAQAKGLEHLQRSLGLDPVRTLNTRAAEAGGTVGAHLANALTKLGDAAAVLSLPPSEVFRFSTRLEHLATVERALVAMVKAHPETAPLVDDVVSAHGFKVVVSGRVADRIPEGAFIDQTVVSYIDVDGATRNLLLTRNPYGEIAHELGRVLVDHGVDNVFVFGTAGGLKAGDEIGDLHAPSEVIKGNGILPFENRAIEIATAIPELLRAKTTVGSRVANVASPVDETLDAVDALRDTGADIVEMELSHLAAALRGSDVSLSALYLVSDLPGTDKTIEKQGHLELDRSLQQAVDVLVEGLGMRGVVLETDARPPPKAPFAGAMALAERALARRGVVDVTTNDTDQSERGLLRYVVARYLMNGLSDRAIESLLADDKADPIDCGQLAPRWKEKALRELAAPYSDDDVIKHLRALNAELKDAVTEVRALGGNADTMAIHILGSVVKGRAGLGSDVDTLLQTKDADLAQRVYESRFGYLGAPTARNVVIGGHDYAMARGDHYGPVLSLGDGQRVLDDGDTLVKVWAEAAKAFGVNLVAKGDSYRVVIDDDALQNAVVERDTNPIAERLLEHEKTFRRSIETDFLLKHLNDLAPLADITAVPLARMVHAGELLLRTRLIPSLTVEKLSALLDSPLGAHKLRSPGGQAFLAAAGLDGASSVDDVKGLLQTRGISALPLALLVDGEVASALMDVGEPYDLLTVDLAAAQRVKTAHQRSEQQGEAWVKPEVFPFFEREVRSAQKAALVAGQRFANPVAARAALQQS